MPGFGHPVGWRATGYRCPMLDKWLARKVPPELVELYTEAMEAIDNLLPHFGDRSDNLSHGMPTPRDLQEVEDIEQALALAGIGIRVSPLYRYILDVQANSA